MHPISTPWRELIGAVLHREQLMRDSRFEVAAYYRGEIVGAGLTISFADDCHKSGQNGELPSPMGFDHIP